MEIETGSIRSSERAATWEHAIITLLETLASPATAAVHSFRLKQ
jgi:hypothetical protein